MDLSDRPHRQERWRPVAGRHEDAVDRARVQVHWWLSTEPKRCSMETALSVGLAAVGVLASLVTPATVHRSRWICAIKIFRRAAMPDGAVGEEAPQSLRH